MLYFKIKRIESNGAKLKHVTIETSKYKILFYLYLIDASYNKLKI